VAKAVAVAVPVREPIVPIRATPYGTPAGKSPALRMDLNAVLTVPDSALARPLAAPVEIPPAPAAEAKPAPATPVAALAPAPAREMTLAKTTSPQQQSDNLYRQGLALLQRGNAIDARPALRKALELQPGNGAARLLLAGSLLETREFGEAGVLLRDGVRLSPERSGLWMMLARMELEESGADAALKTLEQGLASAGDDAEYHAFAAALLQRGGRHDEAVKHYLVALHADPAAPTWLVGVGVSLQAIGKEHDALEAFQRARAGGRLPATLAAFVEQRLESLRR
jgi:MSHA biogenesis protein MshN